MECVSPETPKRVCPNSPGIPIEIPPDCWLETFSYLTLSFRLHVLSKVCRLFACIAIPPLRVFDLSYLLKHDDGSEGTTDVPTLRVKLAPKPETPPGRRMYGGRFRGPAPGSQTMGPFRILPSLVSSSSSPDSVFPLSPRIRILRLSVLDALLFGTLSRCVECWAFCSGVQEVLLTFRSSSSSSSVMGRLLEEGKAEFPVGRPCMHSRSRIRRRRSSVEVDSDTTHSFLPGLVGLCLGKKRRKRRSGSGLRMRDILLREIRGEGEEEEGEEELEDSDSDSESSDSDAHTLFDSSSDSDDDTPVALKKKKRGKKKYSKKKKTQRQPEASASASAADTQQQVHQHYTKTRLADPFARGLAKMTNCRNLYIRAPTTTTTPINITNNPVESFIAFIRLGQQVIASGMSDLRMVSVIGSDEMLGPDFWEALRQQTSPGVEFLEVGDIGKLLGRSGGGGGGGGASRVVSEVLGRCKRVRIRGGQYGSAASPSPDLLSVARALAAGCVNDDVRIVDLFGDYDGSAKGASRGKKKDRTKRRGGGQDDIDIMDGDEDFVLCELNGVGRFGVSDEEGMVGEGVGQHAGYFGGCFAGGDASDGKKKVVVALMRPTNVSCRKQFSEEICCGAAVQKSPPQLLLQSISCRSYRGPSPKRGDTTTTPAVVPASSVVQVSDIFPQLRALDLSHNDDLPAVSLDFSNLPTLHELNLKLLKTHHFVFPGMPCDIPVSELPPEMPEWKRNRIPAAPSCLVILSDANCLTRLNLQESSLREFPFGLRQFVQLEDLCLSENLIPEIPEDGFDLWGNMKRLRLRGLQLKQLPRLSGMPLLEYLDVSYNHLNTFPVSLASLSSLRVLIAGYNWFLDLPVTIPLFSLSRVSSPPFLHSVIAMVRRWLLYGAAPPLPALLLDPSKYRERPRALPRPKKPKPPPPTFEDSDEEEEYYMDSRVYFKEKKILPVYSTSTCPNLSSTSVELNRLMMEIAGRVTYSQNTYSRTRHWYVGQGGWGEPREKRDLMSCWGIAFVAWREIGRFEFGDVIDTEVDDAETFVYLPPPEEEQEKKNGDEPQPPVGHRRNSEGVPQGVGVDPKQGVTIMFRYDAWGVHSRSWNARGRRTFVGCKAQICEKTGKALRTELKHIGFNHEPK